MKLIWTSEARHALRSIWEYVAAADDAEAGDRLILRLADRAETLPGYLEMDRAVSEHAAFGIRELPEGNYLIVYWVKGDDLEVLTVYEGDRLLSDHRVRTPMGCTRVSPCGDVLRPVDLGRQDGAQQLDDDVGRARRRAAGG